MDYFRVMTHLMRVHWVFGVVPGAGVQSPRGAGLTIDAAVEVAFTRGFFF